MIHKVEIHTLKLEILELFKFCFQNQQQLWMGQNPGALRTAVEIQNMFLE